MYKLYCQILNHRLTAWSEVNNVLCDEQNRFRPGRCTFDHAGNLTNVLEDRRKKKLSTFAAFIDFSKAYDKIKRFLASLQSLYKNIKCTVRVNGQQTDWFDVYCGLKQCCILSPMLFNLFINDLTRHINDVGSGISVGDTSLSILLYADDIIIAIFFGGLIAYIHNKFKYILVDTKKQRATGWEYQCIELSHHEPHSQKYLRCNVYRKPGKILDDFNLFLEEFGSFIRLVKNINRSSYICGDYNIDLLKIKTNKHFNEFFDNLITTGFFPKITLPTRFTEQSSTLIDNVFSNNIEERETSGILLNHISDLQLLFTYIEKLSYIERVPKYIDVEKADTISIAKFVKELSDGNIYDQLLKGTDQAGTFMSLKCVAYYANYRSWHQSSKIQVVS